MDKLGELEKFVTRGIEINREGVMPNDVMVPVTAEQLHLFQMWLSDEHEPNCDSGLKVNFDCSCRRSEAVDALDVLVCQAGRIAEWRKNVRVGDRVRLVAMPEVGPYTIRGLDMNCGGSAYLTDPAPNSSGIIGYRFLAELMPEESHGE